MNPRWRSGDGPLDQSRILEAGGFQRKVQRAYSQSVPLTSPSPLDFVRARTIGNWHLSAANPAEFKNPRIDSEGTPTWNFGRVYWPVDVTRGASNWIAVPSQVESAGSAPENCRALDTVGRGAPIVE